MGDTSRSQTISTKLQRIAEQASSHPEMVFTTLAHLIDVDFLREAYNRTRKNASAGVDGVTAAEYGANLEENLRDLYERMRNGRYIAPPVKRTWLAKDGSGRRPIGEPTLEDKIAQRAAVMVLGAIYEQDFHEFSHGFREGHSQHQALQQLWQQCTRMNIGWIVDADVSGFFDNLDHRELRRIIQQRVNDGGILRLIGKWLKAGVLEDGLVTYPEKGTPQGAVISPLLSNIFLHHVLDDWFVREVQPRLEGRCFLLRFADDFVIGCQWEAAARRVMEILPKRFGRFGLTIHPEKTVMTRFSRPKGVGNSAKGSGTFDFLGFTHYWGKSRRGAWVIKRKTKKKSLRRFLRALWVWLRRNRHLPLKEQHRMLSIKLRGHYQYYGVIGNIRMLSKVVHQAGRFWRYWLSRRSHKGHINWAKYADSILSQFALPEPKIYHHS
jgi:RNA-directed DNA polymerase